ncbi:hypothetical protein FA13DRAFT_639043 [Coprinellus micaceus]|uniref:Uncharacterized protein n=1 Tax=Coprinellus micaceus TaxID=71717 RepID=A0A4Y7SAY7_COPMI|nr:hypothetical protein FA13DRAFT_639043 [Coprinellus micaceus]
METVGILEGSHRARKHLPAFPSVLSLPPLCSQGPRTMIQPSSLPPSMGHLSDRSFTLGPPSSDLSRLSSDLRAQARAEAFSRLDPPALRPRLSSLDPCLIWAILASAVRPQVGEELRASASLLPSRSRGANRTRIRAYSSYLVLGTTESQAGRQHYRRLSPPGTATKLEYDELTCRLSPTPVSG